MSNICKYCDHIEFSPTDYNTLICTLTNRKINDPTKETCSKYEVMDYAF